MQTPGESVLGGWGHGVRCLQENLGFCAGPRLIEAATLAAGSYEKKSTPGQESGCISLALA